MHAQNSRRRFFLSRSEGLILAGLVMLVLSALLPGRWAWHRHQRLVMARADLRVLVAAVDRYHQEYGSWPGTRNSSTTDIRYGREISNAEVMNVLRAQEGPGNPQHTGNEQQIVFLEVEPYAEGVSGQDQYGVFRDPWGTPYQMVFDSNFDNVCEVEHSIYGRIIGQGQAIWSCGPDRRSDTEDDLLTWDPQ